MVETPILIPRVQILFSANSHTILATKTSKRQTWSLCAETKPETTNQATKPHQNSKSPHWNKFVNILYPGGSCSWRWHYFSNNQAPGSPLFDDQRKDVWPDEKDLATKLCATADNLRLTTRFTTCCITDLTMASRTQKKKEEAPGSDP